MVAQLVQAVHRLRHAERATAGRAAAPQLPELIHHIVRFSAGGIRAYSKQPKRNRQGRERA
jgi:hypothetical protein